MSSAIYLRIIGYVFTIILHFTNCVSMLLVLQQPEVVELFKEPTVRFFNHNQARYFTCWTFFLQWVHAWLGLVCDYQILKNSHQKGYQLNVHLRRARDVLFTAIVWPSTFLVAGLFWSLYYLDRNLIFPAILDKALTNTSNHIIHTVIVPITLWEGIFNPRGQPKGHMYNLSHLLLHTFVYFCVVLYTYYEQDTWIYPMFKTILSLGGPPLFLAFNASLLLACILFYFMQWPMYRCLRGKEDKAQKTKLR